MDERRQALLRSIGIWRSLAKTGSEKGKRLTELYLNGCPLCDVYYNKTGAYRCPGCPLDDYNCKRDDSPYDRWWFSTYVKGETTEEKIATRKAEAVKILSILKEVYNAEKR